MSKYSDKKWKTKLKIFCYSRSKFKLTQCDLILNNDLLQQMTIYRVSEVLINVEDEIKESKNISYYPRTLKIMQNKQL